MTVPPTPEQLIQHAVEHLQAGRLAEAEDLLRQALPAAPDDAAAHFNLGKVLLIQGRLAESLGCFRQALLLRPVYAEAHCNLGTVLQAQGKRDEAMACYRQAILLKPDFAGAHCNLGKVLMDQGRPDEAIAQYRQAIQIKPDFAEVYSNLGNIFLAQGRLDEAVTHFRQTLRIKPDYAEAFSNLIFTLDLKSDQTAASLQAERRNWSAAYAGNMTAASAHANVPDPERRLRIGYVSADFLQHSAAVVFGAMLKAFDRAAFEVFLYSNAMQEDECTRRFREGATGWRKITGLPDAAVADLIRQDAIDILVDLSGHTAGNRLLAFARKPAPIQLTAWGYIGGTGMAAMDVFLADPVVVPPEERSLYAEAVRYLPCVVSASFPEAFPAVGSLPAAAVQGKEIVFGSFNRLCKLSAEACRTWANVLQAVPHSRLILKTPELDDLATQRRVLDAFIQAGIDAGRIQLLGRTGWRDHMAAFNRIDIALDPYPHGGGVTTLEGLMMGVPAVTLRWPTIPGRLSASILTTLGLTDWIAETPAQYVEIAARQASDWQALAGLRRQLRPRFLASIIGDTAAYARAVEVEYRTLWREWCARRHGVATPQSPPPQEQLLQQAIAHHQSGRLAEAERLYREILQAQPTHAAANHNLGVLAVQVKQPEAALPHFRAALASDPTQAQHWISLIDTLIATEQGNEAQRLLEAGRQKGLTGAAVEALAQKLGGPSAEEANRLAALFNQGPLDEAERQARDLIHRHPVHGFGWKVLGAILSRRGQPAEALQAKETAARLMPEDAEAQHNLGLSQQELGRLEASEASLRHALQLNPAYALACNTLGVTLQKMDRLEESQAMLERALALHPAYAEAHNNLGVTLEKQERLEEAEASYRQALKCKPDYAEAHSSLGNTLNMQDRAEESEAHCREAIRLKPGFAAAYNNLGNALEKQAQAKGDKGEGEKAEKLDEAVACYRKAIELRPEYAEAFYNLGNICQTRKQMSEAMENYQAALTFKPDHANALNNIGGVLMQQGCLDEAVARYRQALSSHPKRAEIHSNLIFAGDMMPDTDTATQQAERRRWNAAHGTSFVTPAHFSNTLDPQRRLRVGYVSADLWQHSAAVVFGALLTAYDAQAYEVYAYSNSPKEDAQTAIFRNSVSHWRKIAGQTDDAVAEQIRQDRIDILVDLSGHSAGNRLPVFARKPAPIQITAWGYVGGTGLNAMDVFFADPVAVPPEERHHYTERIIDLPNFISAYFPNPFPNVGPLPAEKSGQITFGSFNRLCKTSAEAYRSWARILQAVPNSRMILKTGEFKDPATKEKVLAHFKQAGIDPARITLQGGTSWEAHMDAFNQIDLSLDPYPHGGGVTTLEGLMMGVPVVTLRWPTIYGRLSASILTTLDMTDWIAETPQQYIDIAVQKAGDLKGLAELRQNLRPRFKASIIGDTTAYARAVEGEYRKLWQAWCGRRNA